MTTPTRAPSLLESEVRGLHAREVWRLALPVLGQNLLGMFVGWSDTLLSGRILVEAKFLAAVTVASYLLWLMESCSSLIQVGSMAIVARLIGARDSEEAGKIVFDSLLLAVLLGIVLGWAVRSYSIELVGLMGLSGEPRRWAAEYLNIVALAAPFLMVLRVGVTCLQAAGDTRAGMVIMIVVNLVNIGMSWWLTVGGGPVEALGFVGIPWGTAASYLVGGVLSVVWLRHACPAIRLPSRRPVPSIERSKRILRLGVPGAANQWVVVISQLWYLSIIAGLGTASVAAHGVAIRCESISWLSGEAFAVASATLVGQSLGAARPDQARGQGWATLRLGIISLSLMGVAFYAGAWWLFRIFVDPSESQVFELGVPVLQLVAFSTPAQAATIILGGALRGAGDVRAPLVYNIVGLLFVRVPLAYLLTSSWVGLGLYGAWIAMLVDLYVRGAAAFYCFHADTWSRSKV